jgi:hypothetical protein
VFYHLAYPTVPAYSIALYVVPQDGYTLERVDVYGLVDGRHEHEMVVVQGAECYVGRNDNPSFSACTTPFLLPKGSTKRKNRRIWWWSLFKMTLGAVGSEPLRELADTIWHAVGPSGYNKVRARTPLWDVQQPPPPFFFLLTIALTMEREQDYVYNLAAAVRALAPEAYDSHLFALEVRFLYLIISHFAGRDFVGGMGLGHVLWSHQTLILAGTVTRAGSRNYGWSRVLGC